MRFEKVSFKIKLIIFLEILVILVNSFLGFFIWKQLSFMVREISRSKVMAIAQTTAYFIDAQSHEKIWTEKDEERKDYEKIHLILKRMKEANPEVDDVYTIRKSKENNNWTYVAEGFETEDLNGDGAITEEEEPASVGETFDASYSPEVFNALSKPSADYELNCDKWGCFLSGYAPIKDTLGQTVAVAAVDIRAQNVIEFERKTRIVIFVILGFLLVFLPLILYLFLLRITKPISEIAKGIGSFSHDFSVRLPVRSKDEFGMIARKFNNMASELQTLYAGLEDKIKEKTQSLEKKVTEIEEKNAKEEALLTSIGEGMIATDEKGKIIISNSQSETLLGLPTDKIINKKTSDVYNLLNDGEKPIACGQRPEIMALNRTHKITGSFICERIDKVKVPVMITAAPVIFKDKVIGSIIVLRDITREREIDRAKSEFVSLASHQLLTPLANIRWYTEMLSEKNNYSDEKQKRYFSKIEYSSQKMVELVQALLNVSRIEMGNFLIETKPTNMTEIALGVLDELTHKIREKKIKISRRFARGLENFNADPKMLRIIFQNLFSNAVKYTKENGAVDISVDVDKNEKNVLIRVSNNGHGIPQNQKDRMFTKLFRADNARKEEAEGTGLGLYITKSIIDNSGGRIWFDSIENKRTNFYVKYPLSGMKNIKEDKKLI